MKAKILIDIMKVTAIGADISNNDGLMFSFID